MSCETRAPPPASRWFTTDAHWISAYRGHAGMEGIDRQHNEGRPQWKARVDKIAACFSLRLDRAAPARCADGRGVCVPGRDRSPAAAGGARPDVLRLRRG